jgi:DNA-directed RNA polymerase specialized sigma24 family protein
VHGGRRSAPDRHGVVDRLLSLRDFDRFVFVMSVLERYSEHECALLLGCTPPDVREARTRALQHISEERRPRTEEDLFTDEVTSGVGDLHHA